MLLLKLLPLLATLLLPLPTLLLQLLTLLKLLPMLLLLLPTLLLLLPTLLQLLLLQPLMLLPLQLLTLLLQPLLLTLLLLLLHNKTTQLRLYAKREASASFFYANLLITTFGNTRVCDSVAPQKKGFYSEAFFESNINLAHFPHVDGIFALHGRSPHGVP